MTFLLGLDLAWTPHNETGVCLLETHGSRVELRRLGCAVESAVSFAQTVTELGPDVVVAVDAPLVRTASCVAERELARVFGRFHASAYTASVDFLMRRNLMAGPQLGEALRAAGVELNPTSLLPGARGRYAFEMYPHAAHVVYFTLERRLLYKKGRLSARRTGLAGYQSLLATLLERDLPGVAASLELHALLGEGSLIGGGRALKHVEDQLDALTCAYAAFIAWRDGITPEEVFGSHPDGYIVVPGMHRDTRLAPIRRGL